MKYEMSLQILFLKQKVAKMPFLFFQCLSFFFRTLCNKAIVEKYNFHVKTFEQVSTTTIKLLQAAVLLYLSEINYSTAGQDAQYSGGAGTGQANKQPHNSLFKEITVVNLALVHLFALRGCFPWFSSWPTSLWWNWLYLGNIKGVN